MKVKFWYIIFFVAATLIITCLVNPSFLYHRTEVSEQNFAAKNDNYDVQAKASTIDVPRRSTFIGRSAAIYDNTGSQELNSAIESRRNLCIDETTLGTHAYDKQFVKTSSALCPGAYEHVL